MAFCIQLLLCPELMGIYLVSSKMRCRFMTFGCLLCGGAFAVREGFAPYCDPQQFKTMQILFQNILDVGCGELSEI